MEHQAGQSPDRGWPGEATDVNESVFRVAIGVALAAFVASFAWALSTLSLSRPVLPTWACFVLFAGIFPLMFFVLSWGRGLRGLRAWRPGTIPFAELRAYLPLGVIVVACALFTTSWLLVWSAFRAMPEGNPEKVNGAYYARNSSKLTPITEGRYGELQLAEQRSVTAVSAGFYVFGAMFLAWNLRRSRARSATFEGHPVRPA